MPIIRNTMSVALLPIAFASCVCSETLVVEDSSTMERIALYTSKPQMTLDFLASFIFDSDSEHSAVVSGSPENIRRIFEKDQEKDKILWLGHSTFLIRMGDRTILTDPFLSERAGPIKRNVPPVLGMEELPHIDIILVSHNHYDHLDADTLSRLAQDYPEVVVVTAQGNGELIGSLGMKKIVELAWGDETEIIGINIKALPAYHFSGRGLFDHNDALWASFKISLGNDLDLLFVGDSGYKPELARDLAKEGPYTLAILPIGSYGPYNMMGTAHMTPEEASALGKYIIAKRVIGSHWGTIRLSIEPMNEPGERFVTATGVPDSVMKIGEVRELRGDN